MTAGDLDRRDERGDPERRVQPERRMPEQEIGEHTEDERGDRRLGRGTRALVVAGLGRGGGCCESAVPGRRRERR